MRGDIRASRCTTDCFQYGITASLHARTKFSGRQLVKAASRKALEHSLLNSALEGETLYLDPSIIVFKESPKDLRTTIGYMAS